MSDYMNACSYVKDICVLFLPLGERGLCGAVRRANMACGRSVRLRRGLPGMHGIACLGCAAWFAVRYYATDTHLPRVGTLDQSHLRSAHAETEQP